MTCYSIEAIQMCPDIGYCASSVVGASYASDVSCYNEYDYHKPV